MRDLESKDLDRLEKWFDDSSNVWIPPAAKVTGASRILALFRSIFRKYDKIHWEILEIHPLSDNRFFYVCNSWGIMRSMEYRNQVATDITFTETGKISHLSDFFKDTAVFNINHHSLLKESAKS